LRRLLLIFGKDLSDFENARSPRQLDGYRVAYLVAEERSRDR
jgi:hypothetical protein